MMARSTKKNSKARRGRPFSDYSLLDKARSYKFLFMELQHWSAEDSGIGRWRSFSTHPAVFSVTHSRRARLGRVHWRNWPHPLALHVWGPWAGRHGISVLSGRYPSILTG